MDSTATIDITGIASAGAGVGRLPDGRVVFVQRTAPGERVEVRVVEEKRSWARAELVRLVEPAPERREAPCPHYDRCGGCTLEHLEYPAQLEAKGRIVADALERIGGLHVEPPEVVASPRELRYRNRVTFTLLRLRGGRVVAGFHELGRPGRIVDITEACLLPEPAIAEAWGELRAAWGDDAHRMPAGRRLRLTLRASERGEVALLVDGGSGPGRPQELLERVPGLVAVWHRRDRGAARCVAGARSITEHWMDEEVALSGSVFLQVNRGAAARLQKHVLARVGPVDGRRVVDAYAGIGHYTRRLAARGAHTVAIEADADAVEEARRAVGRADGAGADAADAADAPAATGSAEFWMGAVEERLPDALPADVVIVNPPRAGLADAVPTALRDRPPERLIYVSCDAATLARDLERLEPAFALESLRCFDLFPQTAHVETVVEMSARNGDRRAAT